VEVTAAHRSYRRDGGRRERREDIMVREGEEEEVI
jgi:hypothetical protein